jgi:hypothetical protein
MYPPLNEASKAFWSVVHTKKREYPFWVIMRQSTLALELGPKRYFQCTIMHHLGDMFVGFKTRDKKIEFLNRYTSAEDWAP